MAEIISEVFQGEADLYMEWRARYFASPPPDIIKKIHLIGTLNKLPRENTVFIETGTYLGTTAKLIAELGYKVYTIELSEELHRQAQPLLEPLGVTCLQGDSGSILKDLLADMSAATNLLFWLDGHYSGGVTSKGSSDTPITRELFAIENHIKRMDADIIVKVDDIREFGEGDYPSLDRLVEFSNRNFMAWTIQLDSFICSNRRHVITRWR